MSVMIQIRNVPDSLHRRLKAQAATNGLSLSDYLLKEIRDVAYRPSIDELRQRLRELSPVIPDESPADVIRAERDSR
jgi:plasmid stability protein